MAVAPPMIGCILHFWPYRPIEPAGQQPVAAILTFVHSETCVDLCVFLPRRSPEPRTSVLLVPPGGEHPAAGAYATWPLDGWTLADRPVLAREVD